MSRVTRGFTLACLGLLAKPAYGQDSTRVRMASVTYVTSASVYIDAGREAGLGEGAPVQVVRAGVVIATLKVSFLSSHQGSCDIVSQTAPIVVGDSVRFTPALAPVDSTVVAYAPPAAPAPAWHSSLRGRIGAHYLIVGADGGAGFTQPSVDVWIDGRPSPQSPFALAMDIRARRTATTLPSGTAIDNQTRAYQLSLSFSPPTSRTRLTLGRQIALGFSSVGVYDGVSGELNTRRWTGALFTGTQPDPVTLDFSTDLVQAGGYVQRHGGGNGRLWSATVGLSGSYQNGHANREFGLLQGSYSSRQLALFASQEIDYYGALKRTTGAPALSLTSTFATLRYHATERTDFQVGFDNRRNVLLYRDVVNPLVTFDDAFRQGVWAGMYVRLTQRFSAGLDARRSSGGTAGTADAVTATLAANRLGNSMLGLRARTTYYQSPVVDGWLPALGLNADRGIAHIELSGGARIEREHFATANSTITWIAGDLDFNVARAWYLTLSGSVERGPGATSQVYAGFNVRF
jgi:hypothetical protein